MPAPHPSTASTLQSRDLAVVWHPCGQQRDYRDSPPLEVVGAQGSYLELADGTRLLDGISSWWCKALGHGHPRLRAALIAQAGRFEHVILANTTNDGVVRLSERLCALCSDSLTAAGAAAAYRHVFYAGDGSSGVEVALKMALQAQHQRGRTRRTRFAALANGYHGESMGALSVSDCGIYSAPFAPLRFPCTMLGPIPYRSGQDDPRWHDASAEWQAMLPTLDALQDELAAIICEPVLQAAGGMRLYSPDLLVHLRAWATAHDVLLIADEIASGMGRLGRMLACELAPVAPDLIVLSKGLTGGFLPLSAVVTTEDVYRQFDGEWHERRGFLHSNTYCGNALAVAVADAVLDVFAEERVLDQVRDQGAWLRRQLCLPRHRRPVLRNLRSLGMMAAFDLTRPEGSACAPLARTGYQVAQAAVRRGALLRPLGDTVYLLPPLNASLQECGRLLEILCASVDEVLGVQTAGDGG